MKLLARLRDFVITACLFIHIRTLGYTLGLPLLGAISVGHHLDGLQFISLLLVALCTHIFAYVINDILDLPVDRTAPVRAMSPLVRGQIQPGWALVIALLQIPLSFMFTAIFLSRSIGAFVALAASLFFVSIYNLWGKRFFMPPLTDFIQGLSGGALVLYGALVFSDGIERLTVIIITYEVSWLLYANFLGSLKDIINDSRMGLRTTAIFLGCAYQKSGNIRIPRRLVAYATFWFTLTIAIGIFALISNPMKYNASQTALTTVSVLVLVILSIIVYGRVLVLIHRSTTLPSFNTISDTAKWSVLFLMLVPIVLVIFCVSLGTYLLFLMATVLPFLGPTELKFARYYDTKEKPV